MRLAVLMLSMLFTSLPAVHAAEVRSIAQQGIDRLYRLHNREAAVPEPAPLVVHLHGFRRREEAVAGRADLAVTSWEALDRTAMAEGFVVAYPAAYWGQWNLLEGLRNTTLDDGTPIDDITFIFAVVQALIGEGVADPDRVYLTGISDGAILSYRLLCEPASPFAAAVPVVGTMAEVHRDDCAPTYVPPIMVIAGTNDLILPYDGWIFSTGRELSVPETLDHWRRSHGCDGQQARLLDDRRTDDDSRVREVTWTGCAREGAVKLLRVEGGGHIPPSFEPVSDDWRERAGGHNRDIDSADEAWRFLSGFQTSGASPE